MKLVHMIVTMSCLLITGADAPYEERIRFDSKQEIPAGRRDLYSAVGKLTDGHMVCTATLISRRTILSAAHCYEEGREYWFYDSQDRVHQVRAGYALSVDSHRTDIAVLYLVDYVSDIVYPTLQRGAVPKNHQLVIAGFGCKEMVATGDTMRCTGTPTLRENYLLSDDYNDAEGSSSAIFITPGDSGGALINRQTGAIVGVASRYTYRVTFFATQYEEAFFAPIADLVSAIVILD